MQSEIPTDGVRCGVYVVGFFDLSGQSNELLPYVDMNAVSVDFGNIKQDFLRIATLLRDFRRDISMFFKSASETLLASTAPPNAPTELLDFAEELDSPVIKLQGFSDTVVVYFPLAVSPGRASLYKIAVMLLSVASTMLTSFARGSVVRGAIDATWAMEPFDDEIYGPALMSAYRLESEAKWPRVVIGRNMLSLWKTFSNQTISTHLDGMNYIFANIQSYMVFRDTDGQVAVDYLGKTIQDLLMDALEPGLIDAAYVGVESELRKRSGDAKIAGKLQATMEYFESRTGPLTVERRQSAAAFIAKLHNVS